MNRTVAVSTSWAHVPPGPHSAFHCSTATYPSPIRNPLQRYGMDSSKSHPLKLISSTITDRYSSHEFLCQYGAGSLASLRAAFVDPLMPEAIFRHLWIESHSSADAPTLSSPSPATAGLVLYNRSIPSLILDRRGTPLGFGFCAGVGFPSAIRCKYS